MSKMLLLKEIQKFHKSRPTLMEYPILVRKIRKRINDVSEIEKKQLSKMLDEKEIYESEYNQLLQIVEFKRAVYQKLVNGF